MSESTSVQNGTFHGHRYNNSEKATKLIALATAITDIEKILIGCSRSN
jgi:hypothetical protein